MGQYIACPFLILPVRGGNFSEENMGHKGKPNQKHNLITLKTINYNY